MMEAGEHSSVAGGSIPPPSGNSSPASHAPSELQLEGPVHPGSGRKKRDWRRLTAPFGAAGLVLLKLGAKLKALLILLPKLKLLTTSGTMLVSVAAYSLIWGWQFAIGFVLLIFVHEMGHVIQLRREGVKASAPMFIPFMGAVIWAKSLGKNALAEARVGLAGPVLGSLGAAALIPLATATGNNLFKALAFTGFFLNLFNLLPIVPLDGGRAAAALSPKLWIAGLVGMVAMLIAFPNPIILIIAVVSAMEGWRRWQTRNDPEAAEYYRVEPRHRLMVAAVYIGLIVLLALGMTETHIERHFSDV
jgi:Zn-dependent protease